MIRFDVALIKGADMRGWIVPFYFARRRQRVP